MSDFTATDGGISTATPPAQFIPDATYNHHQVAGALQISIVTLHRWRRKGRLKFPRPFMLGSRPHWRGWALNAWQDNRQTEELA